MRSILVRMAVLFLLVVLGSRLSYGDERCPWRQGLYVDGVPAPVLGTAVEVRLTGIIARSKVTQIFTNPSTEWVEGIYLFPLPEDAAVDTLEMTVGDRRLVGEIQEEGEARRTYEAAKQAGTKATLIEQQRPDVFTTSVAHIGPGETVEIAIELQQVVRYEKGRFKLRFPMVVAPPDTAKKGGRGPGFPLPPVLRRGARPINPFAFHADLSPGFPLAKVESSTHPIVVEKGKRFRYAVDLAKGTAPADGDLVLEWTPAVGREPRAVYYSQEVDGEHYSLLMVMPPDAPEAVSSRLARESVFIIDTSGSMSGDSIRQAREALLYALGRMRSDDWFNVVRFSGTASAVFPQSVPATPDAVLKARSFIANLRADGSTRMLSAFEIAMSRTAPTSLVPQVIFATDGQIEDEAEVIQFLSTHLGDRRLFPIAIGSAPNAALLSRLASIGRGSFTQINDVANVSPAMGALFSQLEAPMLQRIDVQWSDPSAEAWPELVPDLYLGEPLVVTARLKDAAGVVSVSGVRGGETWQDSFPAASELKGAGIDKLWARRKIQALSDSQRLGADRAGVRRSIIDLGLRHHLVTDYTSLVAVDVTPTAPAGLEPVKSVIPVNEPRSSEVVMEDVITVTAESPLLDERRMATATTVVKQAELEKIPTARDPWAVLQTTPGAATDRINTGGNESGRQGAVAVDGVRISDMTALGSSPGFYDFDAFEEMKAALSAEEVKDLCAVLRKAGWKNVKLKDVLRAAPSLAGSLRQADAAGLLRGFLALVLHDKGCSAPPPDVLAEARQYVDRFGTARGRQ